MAEDRFSQIKNTESLCFLCLKEADQLCKKCEIPYCSQEHFNVHYDEKIDYCYPFRVMQRPEVSFWVFSQLTKLLVMSPSWNFPARVEPSYEGFEPSRAGAL